MNIAATASIDSLVVLLPDWQRPLRAKNRSSDTIKSCLRYGPALLAFLTANGMPTSAQGVRREHIEAFLPDLLGG
jgi:hypothetical protein